MEMRELEVDNEFGAWGPTIKGWKERAESAEARVREIETDNALLKANWMKGEWIEAEIRAILVRAETAEARVRELEEAINDAKSNSKGCLP